MNNNTHKSLYVLLIALMAGVASISGCATFSGASSCGGAVVSIRRRRDPCRRSRFGMFVFAGL